MSNKRVSQLVELTAGEISSDDLFLIVDATARESKKLQAGQLLAYLESSGSFTATNAETADTASYINPNNVGLIASASHGITSRTASFALAAGSVTSASYALTASFVSGSNLSGTATSASFLVFTPGTPNGTSSFALTSSVTINAFSSSFLIYTGTANGTASYAVRAAVADTATTASFLAASPGSASFATASWAYEAIHALDSDTSDLATLATSANFLNYDGVTPNGTASFALNAKTLIPTTNGFIQSGNSFGTLATLGTTDSNSLTFIANGDRWMTLTQAGRFAVGTTNASAFAQMTIINSQSLNPRSLDCEVDTSVNGTTGSYVSAVAYYGGASVGVNDTVDITGYIAAQDLFTTITGTKTFPACYGSTIAMTFTKTGSVTSSVGYYCSLNSFLNPSSRATVINAAGFRAFIKGNGGGGIVSGSGFYCDPVIANSSSYGIFLSRNSSSNAASQFGVYQLGSDNQNFFEGPVTASLYGTSSQAVTASILSIVQSSSLGPTTQTTASGWIQVRVGTAVRFIPLYT